MVSQFFLKNVQKEAPFCPDSFEQTPDKNSCISWELSIIHPGAYTSVSHLFFGAGDVCYRNLYLYSILIQIWPNKKISWGGELVSSSCNNYLELPWFIGLEPDLPGFELDSTPRW